jgi:endonuclease III
LIEVVITAEDIKKRTKILSQIVRDEKWEDNHSSLIKHDRQIPAIRRRY